MWLLYKRHHNFSIRTFQQRYVPTNIEISSSLEGQLCRCGSHAAVIKAINKLIESP